MAGNQPWHTQSITTSDVPNNLTLTERQDTEGTTLEALTPPASITHRDTVANDVFDQQLNGRVSPRTKEAIAALRQEFGIADNSAFIRQTCYLTLELHERGLLKVEQASPTHTRELKLVLNESDFEMPTTAEVLAPINDQPETLIHLTTFTVNHPKPTAPDASESLPLPPKTSFQWVVDRFYNLFAAIKIRVFNRQDGTR